MSSRVKRTYSRRSKPIRSSSSPPPEDPAPEPPTSSPSSTPPSPPVPTRSLSDVLGFRPPAKKPRLAQSIAKKIKSTSTPSSKWKRNSNKQSLVQLHFSIDASVLRKCPICDLSYTKGAQDDEVLHKSHCARVQRGLEWTRDEIRESVRHGVIEIESGIRLKDRSLGRILSVNANATGKIGSKLVTLFETISLALSSPPLTAQTLANSKTYLFLLTPPVSGAARSGSVGSVAYRPNTRQREKIVGCVIAQPISTAMRVIDGVIHTDRETPNGAETRPIQRDVPVHEDSPAFQPPTARMHSKDVITVDASTSLYCSPEPLPTPLGISRMFVSSSYRRLGIASRLLTAATENFIHGVALDPAKGEVAFTQPTTSGKALMEKWGKDGARVYRE